MIPLRRIIRDLFGFSRSQVNAFVILLPIMFLILFSHPLYRLFQKDRPVFSSRDSAMLDSLVAILEYDSIKVPPEEKRVRHFFKFDPNRISADELDSLGFSEGLATRIVNYRKKVAPSG